MKSIGHYTVDFLLKPTLVVEVEGCYHGSCDNEIERMKYMESRGFVIYRVPTTEVGRDPHGTAKWLKSEAEKLSRSW